jgi:hypothetical protein
MHVLRSSVLRPAIPCRNLTVARSWKKSDGAEKRQKENVRKAVERMKKDGVDEKVARKVRASSLHIVLWLETQHDLTSNLHVREEC